MYRPTLISSAAVALVAGLLGSIAADAAAQTPVVTRPLPPRARADSTAALLARARGIHDRVITMDTHVDIQASLGTEANNPGVRGTRQVDLVKMREGGLDAAFFAVYVGQGARTPEGDESAKAQARAKFEGIHRMAEVQHPDKIAIAYRPDDVARIANSGKLVALIGIENGNVIGKDLSLIKAYFDLGARYMTLTHNGHSHIGDSNTPATPEWGGLSPFGEQVVREMNRVGMMVDISHVGKSTMLHAVRISTAPVIASHSSTTAYANVPRNMDDEQLLALKRNGGVMQTVAFRNYVKVTTPPERGVAVAALRAEFGLPAGGGGGGGGRGAGGGGRGGRGGDTLAAAANAALGGALGARAGGGAGRGDTTAAGAAGRGGRGGGGGGRGGDAALDSLPPERRAEYDRRLAEINAKWPTLPAANVQDFVNHIDHAVKLIGIDHVGISSDFDGGGGVSGWNDASETFNVTFELVRRGYTEAEIAKIWSGNLIRVWREVERAAARTQGAGR